MAELDTITLNELDTVDELLETDTILVERGGRIKRFTGEIGGNDTLIVTDTNSVLNKTFNQIKTALDAGDLIYLSEGNENNTYGSYRKLMCIGYDIYLSDGVYTVMFSDYNNTKSYQTYSQTDYPTLVSS